MPFRSAPTISVVLVRGLSWRRTFAASSRSRAPYSRPAVIPAPLERNGLRLVYRLIVLAYRIAGNANLGLDSSKRGGYHGFCQDEVLTNGDEYDPLICCPPRVNERCQRSGRRTTREHRHGDALKKTREPCRGWKTDGNFASLR